MLEIIQHTSLGKKSKGDPLKSSDINDLNRAVTECIRVLNGFLKRYCDIDAESGSETRCTLSEAIQKVPAGRRNPGMTLRFTSSETEGRVEYEYIGSGNAEHEWTDLGNWVPRLNTIDGGTW